MGLTERGLAVRAPVVRREAAFFGRGEEVFRARFRRGDDFFFDAVDRDVDRRRVAALLEVAFFRAGFLGVRLAARDLFDLGDFFAMAGLYISLDPAGRELH